MTLFFKDLIWLYINKVTAFAYPISILWFAEFVLNLSFVPAVITNFTLILFCYSIIECGLGLSGVKLLLNRSNRNAHCLKVISGLLLIQAFVATVVILIVSIIIHQEKSFVLVIIIISLCCYVFVPEWVYVAYNRNHELAKVLVVCRVTGLTIFGLISSQKMNEPILLLTLNLPIVLAALYHINRYYSHNLHFYTKRLLKRLIIITSILFLGRIFSVLYTTAPVMIITRLVSDDVIFLYYSLDRVKALVTFISTPIATKVWPSLSRSYSKVININSFNEITSKVANYRTVIVAYVIFASSIVYTILYATDNLLDVNNLTNYLIILLITLLPLVIVGSSIYGNYILVGGGQYRAWLNCLYCVTVINILSFYLVFKFYNENVFLVSLVAYILPEIYVFVAFFVACISVNQRKKEKLSNE